MNETLKGVANIGAELAAAKAELQQQHEAHRKTWRQLEQVTGLLREAFDQAPKMMGEDWTTATAMALSLQAEPECRDWVEDFEHENGNYSCLCTDCGNTFAGHKRRFICRICALKAEPGPAQDELRKRFDVIEFEVAQGKHSAASVFTQMRTAAMYIRPAQTEQQPEQSETSVFNKWCMAHWGEPAKRLTRLEGHHLLEAWQARAALSATPSPAMDAKEE